MFDAKAKAPRAMSFASVGGSACLRILGRGGGRNRCGVGSMATSVPAANVASTPIVSGAADAGGT